LASAGRQTGTTLGVAIAGTIVGSALARGGTAFTSAAHGVWWMVLGLGLGILALGLLSTGRWALDTAGGGDAISRAAMRSGERPGTSRCSPSFPTWIWTSTVPGLSRLTRSGPA
jgi:hypothetical protein